MQTKNTTVGIIGCGKGGEGVGGHSIGYRHAQVYTELGYDIVAACDLNKENLDRFAKEYNVDYSALNLSELLDSVQPDIVSICTYVGSHLTIFKQCVEAGVKALFVEKPLCLTMNDGLTMLDLAKRHDVKVAVNHYRRYLPRFIEAKRLIDDGVIGQPVFYFAGINDWDLMEWGTHWLDMFRFLSGDREISWVLGQAEVGEKVGYGHTMEDHALCYCQFSDGSKALLDGGRGFNGDAAIRIVGTEGVMSIPDFEPATYLNADGVTEFAAGTNIHHDPKDKAWQDLLSEFADWQDGQDAPQCSLENAIKSSELYLAAYESAVRRGNIMPPMDASYDEFALDLLKNQKGK